MTDPRLRAAAIDNACWCAVFCRSHGVAGGFWSLDGGRVPPRAAALWASPTRTPPGYPDAVTLRPGVPADAVLGRIDASVGCSVKDSFAALDLRPAGFGVLARASWLWMDGPIESLSGAVAWRRVGDPAQLQRWEADWAGGDGAAGVFPDSLLHHPDVALMTGTRGGRPVAGGVLTRTGGAVGMSNVFVLDADPVEARQGLAQAAGALWGQRPLVGYESGLDLEAASAAGFATIGELVIWLRGD